MPGSRGSRGSGLLVFLRPASAFALGADVLAGYVIASPAAPDEAEALAVVPFLFASAWLLSAAGSVFAVAFGFDGRQGDGRTAPGAAGTSGSLSEPATPVGSLEGAAGTSGPGGLSVLFAEEVARGRMTVKRAFLAGAALSFGGLFAAMGAAASTGKLPVYFAAFIFLVNWARAGQASRPASPRPD